MSPPRVPLHHRLAVRQSVPILTGFVGVLACLLVMGYLYTREQIVETARLQVEQMVRSNIKQQGYTHSWIEAVMGPVSRLTSELVPLPAARRHELDNRIVGIMSDERGGQTVEVTLLAPDGTLWQRIYTTQGARPGAVSSPDPQDKRWTPQSVATFTAPRWLSPTVETAPDQSRFVTIRYAALLFKTLPDGSRTVAGVCTLSLGMPWFADRLRSSRAFENCLVFFMTHNGQWTLPPDADAPLAALKNRVLAPEDGETGDREFPVTYKEQPWLAVFMPLQPYQSATQEATQDASLYLGVFIPRDNLFGSLYRLTRFLVICGLVVLVLAAWSLHRTSTHLLSPLPSLRELAARLARGELSTLPDAAPALPPPPFPDEHQQLKMTAETIRQDLRQRVNDLTLIGRTRERLFGELTFARNLQATLRPAPLPLLTEVEVATFVHTAENVCGDLYDYFLQSPRMLCCVMGSVTERGVPAALLMGRIGPLLHELLLSGLGPGKALESVNRMLTDNAPLHSTPSAMTRSTPNPAMVSVLAGCLNLDTGIFCWASAGQLPPLRLFGAEAVWMDWLSNVALGIRADEVYLEQNVRLDPGESLFFAGQRLLSLSGADGELYTGEQVRRFLQQRSEPLAEQLPLLFADICRTLGREPQEDLTCFAVRWLGRTHGQRS